MNRRARRNEARLSFAEFSAVCRIADGLALGPKWPNALHGNSKDARLVGDKTPSEGGSGSRILVGSGMAQAIGNARNPGLQRRIRGRERVRTIGGRPYDEAGSYGAWFRQAHVGAPQPRTGCCWTLGPRRG